MARLSVKDQGIGIAKTDIARIFRRFERAVSSDHYGGLGLGLFVVRQVVEAHGGDVRVESSPGAGSEFIVELPMMVLADEPRTESAP
jgi:two-component system OmpR family sensor kinase